MTAEGKDQVHDLLEQLDKAKVQLDRARENQENVAAEVIPQLKKLVHLYL